jgi:hypothetical protein
LLQEYLSETRNRLLWVELLQPQVEGKAEGTVLPDRYRTTTYDYTNNRGVLTTGRLDDTREPIEVSEAGYQPLPNREEFDEAVEILGEDYDLGRPRHKLCNTWVVFAGSPQLLVSQRGLSTGKVILPE